MRCSLSMCVTFISSVLASRSSPCARLVLPSIEHSIGLRLPDETGISLFVIWFRQKVAPSRCVAIFVELRHSLGAPIKRALLRRFPGPRFRCRLRACSSSLTSCTSDTRVNYSPRQQPQVARVAYYKTPKLNSRPPRWVQLCRGA